MIASPKNSIGEATQLRIHTTAGVFPAAGQGGFLKESLMLVLSRYPGERIIIGQGADQIIVTVLSIDQGQVRLGISAPPEVSVWREEIAPKPDDPRTQPE